MDFRTVDNYIASANACQDRKHEKLLIFFFFFHIFHLEENRTPIIAFYKTLLYNLYNNLEANASFATGQFSAMIWQERNSHASAAALTYHQCSHYNIERIFMKRKFHPMPWIMFLSAFALVGMLIYFSCITYSQIRTTSSELKTALNTVSQAQTQLQASEQIIASAATQTVVKANTSGQGTQNTATISQSSRTSVFSQNEDDSFSDTTHSGAAASDTTYSDASYSGTAVSENVTPNGYTVGIDPGHQGYNVDMSDTEPLGPGSTEMKVKATTGTQGTYTGLPEYQLNLDVSLKLKTILESRGYEVIMTRTDNDTAISNKERAELVASEGADIFVRIHANGDDTHTASGALTMAPSPENPYVSYLSSDSVLLAQCILDSYCEATGFKNLGVQYYDNMSGINWSTIPVTILEMGFMTNEYDDTQMSNSDFQTIMAEGIANGIDAYFE